MISYIGTINPTSTAFKSGCTAETLNRLVFLETTSSTLRQYDMDTLSQYGSNLSVTSTSVSVTMVDAASAIIANTTTNYQLVDLDTQTISTISGATSQFNSGLIQTQQAASDLNAKIVFIALNNTLRSLSRFNGNTYTINTFVVDDFPSDSNVSCIILKEPGRFLVGCGHIIVEMDLTGTVVDRMVLHNFIGGNSSNNVRVATMNYDHGLLTVTDSGGGICLYDWTTKTRLHRHAASYNTGNLTYTNSSSGSFIGTTFTGSQGTFGQVPIMELSSHSGIEVQGFLSTDTTLGDIACSGLNSITGRGWAAHSQGSNYRIHVFDVIPRPTVERTFSSPNNEPFRLILIDETLGQGNLKRVIDTYTTSPRTLLVEPGKNYLEIIKVGNGTDAKWDLSRWSS